MKHANRLELALEHIPASNVVTDTFWDDEIFTQAEELLQETAKDDGIWGKAEWYYFAGENGISADVADQLWYWYHPDKYDGDLYAEKRRQANFDRPGVPEHMAEEIRRADTEDTLTTPEDAREFLRDYEVK